MTSIQLNIQKKCKKRIRNPKTNLIIEEVKEIKNKKSKDSHSLQKPCEHCRCKYNSKFSDDSREVVNTEFWSKAWESRRKFIAQCATKLHGKRRRGLTKSRNNSYRYFFQKYHWG